MLRVRPVQISTILPIRYFNHAAGLVCAACVASLVAFGASAEENAAPVAKITLHYLTKDYDEPIPLSLVAKILTDNGLQGARLGVADNDKSGRFVNQEYTLVEHVLPADADVAAEAKTILADGPAAIIADLEAEDLLAVADLPEAKGAIVFNVRLSDDSLRAQQCRKNVFDVALSYAMCADALAQYLVWKKWPKWFLLAGTAPSDADYAAMVTRAAGRFGGKIVEERVYEFDAANPRTDSGHQQIQTQMPQVTQGASSHDVVWIVDTVERFGEYVPYRLAEPRPVVGTQGLSAVAWHRSYEQYAGTQMQNRFERFAKRTMTERNFSAWLSARSIGEAALRSSKTGIPDLRTYILSPAFTVAGFKGESLSFRQWDTQHRQADADHGSPLPRLYVAAGRLSAREESERHARLRHA